MADDKVAVFLSQYEDKVFKHALQLRALLIKSLPGVTEQLDAPAKMIAYCYGQKYSDLVCVIIPSKKGLKLGFNKGNELPDPEKILEGKGKISRYVVIKNENIKSVAVKTLINEAYKAYKLRSV